MKSTGCPCAALAIRSTKFGCTSTPAMAIASDILVLNLIAAEAATMIGRKKNAPSPITLRRVSVGAPFSTTPDISSTIASSLTIEPPIMAGISGDMVPINASRMPAPMRRRVILSLRGSARSTRAPSGSSFRTSAYACDTVLPMMTWHWFSLRTTPSTPGMALRRAASTALSSFSTKRRRVMQCVTAATLPPPPIASTTAPASAT